MDEIQKHLDGADIVVGHNYGASLALQHARPHQKVVAWNPIGLSPRLGWRGWWWAIVFRFPVVARLLLWAVRRGSVLADARNDRVARCIARHIHVSLFDAHWKDVVQHISAAALIVQSARDHDLPNTFVSTLLSILQRDSWSTAALDVCQK